MANTKNQNVNNEATQRKDVLRKAWNSYFKKDQSFLI